MNYVLPGMGASSAMYGEPWRGLVDTVFVDWPPYAGEQSVGQVAEAIMGAYDICATDQLYGSSLGGMVCCEIAKRLGIERIVLLGSALDPHEVNAFLRKITPAIDVLPITWGQSCCRHFGNPVLKMFAQSDPKFIRSMCKAIMRWEGVDRNVFDIVRIHGRHDWLIPLPQKVDAIIEGGHLIAMTQAHECVAQLKEMGCWC